MADNTNVTAKMEENKVITVTCGALTGRLHMNLFYCPGIRRDCIEVDGKFVSPKIFAVLGDKQKLKNWKHAIRIDGVQIRKYLNSGQLDFYKHNELCTGRCMPRARNFKFEMRDDPDDCMDDFTAIKDEHHNEDQEDAALGMMGDPEDGEDVSEPSIEDMQRMQELMISHQQALSELAQSADELSGDEEDRKFWKGIVDLGLADEFFREIKSSLDFLKNNMIKNFVPMDDAKVISQVVTELGLMNKMKHKLAAHKTDMEKQQQKLDREMEELKKRYVEFEQKKELLKRKSDCFDQLMVISQIKKERTDVESPLPMPHSPQQ